MSPESFLLLVGSAWLLLTAMMVRGILRVSRPPHHKSETRQAEPQP